MRKSSKPSNSIITTTDNRNYKRVSRWIKVNSMYISKRHSLADYADFSGITEDESANEVSACGLLHYFNFQNRQYALGQFMRLTVPEMFELENGKTSHLSGYDATSAYKPLLLEFSEACEYVRLYESYEKEEKAS